MAALPAVAWLPPPPLAAAAAGALLPRRARGQPAAAAAAGAPSAQPRELRLDCEGESLAVGGPAPAGVIPECEWLGVPFNCKQGDCGHCRVKILKGADALTTPTEKELAYFGGRERMGPLRLACQLRLCGRAEIERVSGST
eukprot:TRINITY_DN66386_c0_g1_i1.p2 TRINITY_DN66386_c0_g1~~TRINITY_DN66386_c0_g1_i1.p2  ORF type:complete len:141 (+),score=30.63 TRINITY_DN66386_c0_g1_i1:81-503(+)